MKNFEFEYEGKKYWYSRSVAVLGIVVGFKHGKTYILANKRGEGTPDYQGCWCMPCGYSDFNETVEQAISREVFEETGVKLSKYDFIFLDIDSQPKDRQNVTIRYRTATQIDGHTLTNEYSEKGEVDDIKWIPLTDVNNYDWAFNHLELIHQYIC